MKMRKISTILAIAAVTTLAACGSDAPKTSAELEGLLVSAEETGVEGLTDGTVQRDFALPEFGAFAAPDDAPQECKDAISKAGGLTYARSGSVGKMLSSTDQERMVTVALYSSENEDQTKAIGETLTQVGNACDGQVTEQGENTFTLGKAPDGYKGVLMTTNMSGLESDTLALVAHKGAQMAYVTGISMPADQVQAVLDAQVEKL